MGHRDRAEPKRLEGTSSQRVRATAEAIKRNPGLADLLIELEADDYFRARVERTNCSGLASSASTQPQPPNADT
jgi:hypothetical protein